MKLETLEKGKEILERLNAIEESLIVLSRLDLKSPYSRRPSFVKRSFFGGLSEHGVNKIEGDLIQQIKGELEFTKEKLTQELELI